MNYQCAIGARARVLKQLMRSALALPYSRFLLRIASCLRRRRRRPPNTVDTWPPLSHYGSAPGPRWALCLSGFHRWVITGSLSPHSRIELNAREHYRYLPSLFSSSVRGFYTVRFLAYTSKISQQCVYMRSILFAIRIRSSGLYICNVSILARQLPRLFHSREGFTFDFYFLSWATHLYRGDWEFSEWGKVSIRWPWESFPSPLIRCL